jgi:AcrR family transcriptional regulator
MTTTTRERVLAGAAALAARDGFDELSIAALSGTSGVSVGSIYHHFGSKVGVLAALLVGIVQSNQAVLLDALERHPDDPRGGVLAVVDAQLRWVQDHRDDARLLLDHRDQLAGHTQVRKLNQRFLKINRAWLDRQARAGRLPELTVEIAHAIVFAPAREVTRLWLTKRGFRDPTTFSAALGHAAWAGLHATDTKDPT